MSLLTANDIYKSFLFKGVLSPVLKGINLSLDEGEFISIVGSSGCGKSTLLELLSGITLPDSGEVFYNGQKITGKTGLLGYMPQEDLLFPWLKTFDNILLPKRIQGSDIRQAKAKVKELLPIFGLENFADHLPWQLSGGLRQRVALARTYMTGSTILLLDEPLANLDAITRLSLQDWLKELVSRLGLTVLLVTHDLAEAIRLSNRILIMKEGIFLDSIQIPAGISEADAILLNQRVKSLL